MKHESAYGKHWRRLAELLGPEEAAAERARVSADMHVDNYRKRIAKFKKELPKLREFLAKAERNNKHQYAYRLKKQIAHREQALAKAREGQPDE